MTEESTTTEFVSGEAAPVAPVAEKKSKEISPKPLTKTPKRDTLSSGRTRKKKSSTQVKLVGLASYEDSDTLKWERNEVREVSDKDADRLLSIVKFGRRAFVISTD